MTARDVTRFCACFSARKSGYFLHSLRGDFLTNLHGKPGERGNNPLENIQKKNPVAPAPRNCKFLSLVVVERVLRYWPGPYADVCRGFCRTQDFSGHVSTTKMRRKGPKEYLDHRGPKIRVFRVCFRAPFLPPLFP